jgi:hypothetical protein
MSSLLMPDHAALFRVLEETCVRRWGWTVRSAAGPEDLLRKLRALPSDLVVLVAGLPDWPVAETLRALRAEAGAAGARTLLLARPEDRPPAPTPAVDGPDAVLQWPAVPGALEAAIAALLREAPRTAPRRSVPVPVRLLGPTSSWRGRLRNIGRGGAFVSLPQPLPLEAQVALSVRLPGPAGGDLSARGVVVRQVTADDASHRLAGVAIRFTDLDDASLDRLDRFLRDEPSQAPPPAERREPHP